MSKLAELIREIEKPTPDDIIKILFSLISTKQITKDPERVHRVIYALKQEHPMLFDKFEFDKSGLVPFSDLLDRVLFRLETSTLLGTINPTFSHYELSEDVKQYLQGSLIKFSEEQQGELRKTSEQFEELMNAGI